MTEGGRGGRVALPAYHAGMTDFGAGGSGVGAKGGVLAQQMWLTSLLGHMNTGSSQQPAARESVGQWVSSQSRLFEDWQSEVFGPKK